MWPLLLSAAVLAAAPGHRQLQPGGGPTHGTAVEAICDGSELPLTTEAGTVFRTETPADQRVALDCGRLIHAPDGSSVQLTFSAIALGNSPSGAALSVYDGADETAPILAVFSGDQIPCVHKHSRRCSRFLDPFLREVACDVQANCSLDGCRHVPQTAKTGTRDGRTTDLLRRLDGASSFAFFQSSSGCIETGG